MQFHSKIVFPTLGALALTAVGAIYYGVDQSNAAVPALGTIVGREATATTLELTILPSNGADAFGVRVIPACFAVVGNGDPWPNANPVCR